MLKLRLTHFCKVLFFIFIFCVFVQAQKQPEISFTVSMPKPYTHLLDVEMRVRAADKLSNATDLVMPVWTPGSYLIREYARHVMDFDAKDGNGNKLAWEKANKNTWRIETNNAKELVATYRVYSNELTVRTNELNDKHAFWNNAALLMYPSGQLKSPSTIRVVPYGNWRAATALPAADAKKNIFRAESFDELYDSPFEVSDYKEISFEAKGAMHRMAISGYGNYDPVRLRNDLKKLVETAIDMFGGTPPYKDYLFILHLRSNAGGGLEHANSCVMGTRPFSFSSSAGYTNFLTLVAHEYFHLWNVKRIRPDALGPFDYTEENYTKLLWVAEGITDYYEEILVRRAGLMTDRQFLTELAMNVQSLQNRPGRFQTSLEEASFDAWIKGYRPDENAINREISYYDKGGIVGALLDLEIRNSTKGAKTLDDVMRYLYSEFYKRNRNYTPQDFQRACESAAGKSLENFFDSYVRGKSEIDYNAFLSAAGLKLDKFGGQPQSLVKETAFFGANLAQEGERLMVRAVPADTPAYEQEINSGDQIIALDGYRVNLQEFNSRIAEKKPGDKIVLTVFRYDELRTFEVKLGGRINAPFTILKVEKPSQEQQKIYREWIG